MGKKMKKNKDAPYSPKALVTKRPLAVSLAMRMRGRSHWPLAISFSAITFSKPAALLWSDKPFKPAALLWSDKPLFVAIKDTLSLTFSRRPFCVHTFQMCHCLILFWYSLPGYCWLYALFRGRCPRLLTASEGLAVSPSRRMLWKSLEGCI